jgi:hypothetical protein
MVTKRNDQRFIDNKEVLNQVLLKIVILSEFCEVPCMEKGYHSTRIRGNGD